MQFQTLVIFFVALAAFFASCQKDDSGSKPAEGFADMPMAKPVSPGKVDEASGIADSKQNPGFLWVEQDSGNSNDIALLSHDGSFYKTIKVNLATNRDWEDMALGSGPVSGTTYIYLADIGDNTLSATDYFIYRFPEPSSTTDVVAAVEKISFKYPDGAHDAEAILVDNTTKDIYIISKQDIPSKVYKLAYPQSTSTVTTAVLTGTLPFSGATSACISPDGKDILIKTYTAIWQWEKETGQTMEQALSGEPLPAAYQVEPQGEAICFKNDNTGFYTLSERPAVIAAVNLNFYKRK